MHAIWQCPVLMVVSVSWLQLCSNYRLIWAIEKMIRILNPWPAVKCSAVCNISITGIACNLSKLYLRCQQADDPKANTPNGPLQCCHRGKSSASYSNEEQATLEGVKSIQARPSWPNTQWPRDVARGLVTKVSVAVKLDLA
ncbi:hypothetical protein BDZ91DRAFT_764838 [Kalaharituber pfeilii]|nr:hypothetical protein BDZ91DRAFT_764838 [Kalaharituber pfeilii]